MAEGDLEIRLARAGDAGAVLRIVRSAFVKYTPRIGREPYPMGVDYAEPIDRGQCWIAFYARHGYRETHRDEQHGFRRVFFTKPVLC